MSVRTVLAVLCLGIVVSVATTGAQTLTTSLTIAQAVDEALAHNLSLLAERSNLSIAEAAMITARLRPNPVFSFSTDHLDLLGTGFSPANNGGPAEIAWRLDVPLERGGKREARMAHAALIRTVAEAQFAEAVRALRLDVTLVGIDVLAARATRALVADNLRAFEEVVRVNRARATAGSIAPFESTRSEVAMLQFRSNVVRADLELAAAMGRLRALLGRPASDPFELTGDLGRSQTPDVPDLARLERVALTSRPDVRALELAQARSTADLRLQEALGKVDYSVGAEYRRQQGVAGRSNSLGFFFSTPLPLSNRNQGEIARAAAETEQAARQLAARRAQVVADVRASHHEYQTTDALVAAIERDLLTPATRAREISSYTYTAGGSTLLELIDAQRAFNDTMQSYVDARSALWRAATRLNAAVGQEVVP